MIWCLLMQTPKTGSHTTFLVAEYKYDENWISIHGMSIEMGWMDISQVQYGGTVMVMGMVMGVVIWPGPGHACHARAKRCSVQAWLWYPGIHCYPSSLYTFTDRAQRIRSVLLFMDSDGPIYDTFSTSCQKFFFFQPIKIQISKPQCGHEPRVGGWRL